MTQKELNKLSRRELLTLLLDVSKENELLRSQLNDTQRRLASRDIRLKHSGSIAEAALRLNGIFEAAQAAADLYLDTIKKKAEGNLQ